MYYSNSDFYFYYKTNLIRLCKVNVFSRDKSSFQSILVSAYILQKNICNTTF